jgi:hypothetical protein
MPAVIRSQTKYSVIQSFRAWSERILIEAAQEDLYRKYPGTAVRPLRRSTLRRAIRLFFKSGFRLTPPPTRRWLMHRLLVRKGQDWNPA